MTNDSSNSKLSDYTNMEACTNRNSAAVHYKISQASQADPSNKCVAWSPNKMDNKIAHALATDDLMRQISSRKWYRDALEMFHKVTPHSSYNETNMDCSNTGPPKREILNSTRLQHLTRFAASTSVHNIVLNVKSSRRVDSEMPVVASKISVWVQMCVEH